MTVLALVVDDGHGPNRRVVVPPETLAVVRWLVDERRHQATKFDPADDVVHARDGLSEGTFYERQVTNYLGRAAYLGVDTPLGVQALLKLVATVMSMPEALLRGGLVAELPPAGRPSGELT